jgi:hypothetical protein
VGSLGEVVIRATNLPLVNTNCRRGIILVVTSGPVLDNSTSLIKSLAREQHQKVKEAVHIKFNNNASMNHNDGWDLPNLYLPQLLRRDAGGTNEDTNAADLGFVSVWPMSLP